MEVTKLSVVVPAYNEESGISSLLDDIKKTMAKVEENYEVIVVDDGSQDRTAEIVKSFKWVKLIQHERNKGYGAAIKTGIKNAEGESILIIDADGTYSPEEIPKLLKDAPRYDMVVGARTGEKVEIPLLRRPGKFILSKLANYLTDAKIPDLNSGLRIFKRATAVRFFNLLPSKFSFTTTITIAYLCNDYSIKFIPINYYKRKGKSKISPFKDGLSFILLIIKSVIYFNPLKVFMPAGTVFFLLGAITFARDLINSNITELAVVLLFMAIQLWAFGLLADMIAKSKHITNTRDP